MPVAVPKVWGATETLVHTDFNNTSNVFAAALSQINAQSMLGNAGITSRQMSSRYHKSGWPGLILVPFSFAQDWGTAFGAGTRYQVPTAARTIWEATVRLKPGQEAWVAFFQAMALSITLGSSSENPQLELKVDGVTVGGQAMDLTVGGQHEIIQHTNPLANRLMPIADGQVVSLELVASSAANPCYLSGLSVDVVTVEEHFS